MGSEAGPVEINGLLVIDKPDGWTSRDAVNRVGSVVGRKTKVGHAGTLDPMATGVLVVAIGPATRLIEYVQQMPKTYLATVRLGGRSDTDDAEGEIVSTLSPRIPDVDQILRALQAQIGTIQQLPPRYSALKLGGRRAYDLARQGEDVTLAPRPVRIDEIQVHSYEWPDLQIEVRCGSGTYIRAIARDLGDALDCGGYLTALRRTRIGEFTAEQGIGPENLTRADLLERLRPPSAAVAHLPAVELDQAQVGLVRQGRALDAARVRWSNAASASGEVALFDEAKNLVAIGEVVPDGGLAPRRVLA